MKYRKIKPRSEKGLLRAKVGQLQFEVLKRERGERCQIHNKNCPQLGRCHIISIGESRKLEFCDENVVLTGWFCSHYYLHHNSDDERAVFAKKRICEMLGCESWEAVRQYLKSREQYMGNLTKEYYLAKLYDYKERLKQFLKGDAFQKNGNSY